MSGANDWLFRIQDMIEHMDFISESLSRVEKREFLNDRVLCQSTERSFEVIGEAARFVPAHVQEKYTGIQWAKIIGMRHRIAHNYLEVDHELLWDLYENDFYNLKEELENILDKEDQ